LIAISRLWTQSVNWSHVKNKYVMLGVTGPNEYENNVNNNWHTNLLAVWTLNYTMENMGWLREHNPERYREVVRKTRFKEKAELSAWKKIAEEMYFPEDRSEERRVGKEGRVRW